MEYFEQGAKKQKKFTIFVVFAIIFGALALISFVCNIIYYMSTIASYVENYGATYGYTWSSMLTQTAYSIFEPLATLGGVAVLMLAANSIVCKLSAQTQPESVTEAVVEEFGIDDSEDQEDEASQDKGIEEEEA